MVERSWYFVIKEVQQRSKLSSNQIAGNRSPGGRVITSIDRAKDRYRSEISEEDGFTRSDRSIGIPDRDNESFLLSINCTSGSVDTTCWETIRRPDDLRMFRFSNRKSDGEAKTRQELYGTQHLLIIDEEPTS
ncbi:hypothetical protein GWI33_003313 [Rhynchophorus ferrugineus]|uniref:Uncharacterized protein n=1 Tax=Rhynchophorus ferrugineus TaxID=354439 RepID=A0A834IXY4_RHYFE|nr:hypothetical protein GWI33_003313 [Rhynchophorus ferrugineus]